MFSWSLRHTLCIGLFIHGFNLLCVTTPSHAADFTIQSGQTVNAPQTLDTPGDTGTIEAGGTINTAGDAVAATGGVDGVTVNNAGDVISTNQDAIDVNDDNTITNSGLLQSGNGGGDEGIEGGSNNTIVNSGTITSAADDAIDVNDNNVITNSGTIQGGNGGGDRGIEAGDGNTITNTSNITSVGDDAINVGSGNAITNSGLLQGGNGGGDEGIAGASNNTIDNSGTIISTADDAIDVNDNNVINNSGTIQGGNGGGDSGIEASNGNTITNSGTITSGGDDAIDVLDNNVITNSGTLRGGNGGGDRGIEGRDGNTITNSGQITSPEDDGINVRDNNTVNNSGFVQGGASGDQGIRVRHNNTVENSGTVISQNNDAISGGNDNTVINTGLAQGGAAANQQGVDLANDGTLINSGTILGGEAVEMSGDATLINTGTIQSLLGPTGTAIDFVGGGDDTLALSGDFRIIGAINFRGGTDTIIYGPGIGSVLTFGIGGLPENITTNGLPFAVLGDQIAVVDPAIFGQTDEMLSDLTSGIFNAVHARLSHRTFSGAGSSAFALGGGSLMNLGARMNLMSDGAPPDAGSTDLSANVWGQAFGIYRDQEATTTSVSASHTYVGGIAGLDGWISKSIQIGGFAGGASGELKIPLRHDLDVDSFFGGAYANFTNGQSFLRVLLTAGTSDHESSRPVANNTVAGGLQTAIASFDGDFISPEVAVGTTWNLGWLTIEPSVRLRYAHLSLDGYAETGAAGNFAVGDRDVSLWQGRAQLAFPFTSEAGTLAPRVGIEAWDADHDTVSGVLLGQAITFSPVGEDDDVTGFVGATATTKFGNASFFVDGEIHVGDDGYARSEAYAGIRIPF